MRKIKSRVLGILAVAAVASLFTVCKVIGAGSGSDPEEDIGNSALSVKTISAFHVTSPVEAVGVIDETGHTIAVSVPSGTDITAMTASISFSGESVIPASGEAVDFSDSGANPQTFTVRAADGSTAEYTVTVATDMVTGVSVSPATPTVTRGTSQAFTADVSYTGNPATTVTWDVDSLISSIDEFGVLTVPVNETAATLTVTATSTANPGVSGTATVTVYSISIAPGAGVLSPAFASGTDTYSVNAPSYVGTVTFTATATPSATVTYALGETSDFSAAEPVATLSGLTGSVSFRVKVSAGSTDLIWGPYTFNVTRAMEYTVGSGLVYETFEGDDYEGIKFTGGTGTFTVDALASPNADLLVVGGGGSGGGYYQPGGGGGTNDGGGGGAGGLVYKTGFTVQASVYTVSIGSGGGGVPYNYNGVPGGLSTFYLNSAGEPANGISDSGAKAPGGGYGGRANGGAGGAGGSGGGGGRWSSGAEGLANGGATVAGHDGAAGVATSGGGGGGGAGGPGQASTGLGNGSTSGGLGGPGLTLDITGTPYTYATGGTGGSPQSRGGVNYGDGGGGGNYTGGGAAHSGIVIIRWAK